MCPLKDVKGLINYLVNWHPSVQFQTKRFNSSASIEFIFCLEL
jgi:hypothetical protein